MRVYINALARAPKATFLRRTLRIKFKKKNLRFLAVG